MGWPPIERFDGAALGLAIGGAGLRVAGTVLAGLGLRESEQRDRSQFCLRVHGIGVSGAF